VSTPRSSAISAHPSRRDRSMSAAKSRSDRESRSSLATINPPARPVATPSCQSPRPNGSSARPDPVRRRCPPQRRLARGDGLLRPRRRGNPVPSVADRGRRDFLRTGDCPNRWRRRATATSTTWGSAHFASLSHIEASSPGKSTPGRIACERGASGAELEHRRSGGKTLAFDARTRKPTALAFTSPERR
jgi:hypothetical protein